MPANLATKKWRIIEKSLLRVFEPYLWYKGETKNIFPSEQKKKMGLIATVRDCLKSNLEGV